MQTAVGLSELIQVFRLALTVEGLRPHTIHNYTRYAQRFAQRVNGRKLKSITAADIRAYIANLQATYSPKTVNEAQLALRCFFRFLLGEGEIGRDPTCDMKLVRYLVNPQPTSSEAEVKRLLLAYDTRSREGIRNRAMLTVLFDTGVREGELVSMGLPDWDSRRVYVDGKSGIRQVYLGIAAIQAVERYVRRWGISEAPLWRGKKGPLTGSGVLQAVRRLCHRAGVEDKGVHAF